VVLPLWVVEYRPSPLLWPMAYTTACTTVQAVINGTYCCEARDVLLIEHSSCLLCMRSLVSSSSSSMTVSLHARDNQPYGMRETRFHFNSSRQSRPETSWLYRICEIHSSGSTRRKFMALMNWSNYAIRYVWHLAWSKAWPDSVIHKWLTIHVFVPKEDI